MTVRDNGKGIKKEKLTEIRKALQREVFDGKHIGLLNVQKRIQMLFGTEYGVQIFSEEGSGTTVEIHLPKIDKRAE